MLRVLLLLCSLPLTLPLKPEAHTFQGHFINDCLLSCIFTYLVTSRIKKKEKKRKKLCYL